MLIRIITVGLCALLTACSSVGPQRLLLPVERVQLFPDFTYAVISFDNSAAVVGAHVLCKDDGSRSYTLETADLPICTSPDRGLLMAFTDPWSQTNQSVYQVRGNLFLRFIPVSKRQLVGSSEPEAGRYILAGRIDPLRAARRRGNVSVRVAEVFEKDLKIFKIEPTKVHYLGHAPGGQRLEWLDPKDIIDALSTVPEFDKNRLVAAPPEIVQSECSGDQDLQQCNIQ